MLINVYTPTLMKPARPNSPSLPRPWFREPFVWMVIAGPLIVVIASIATVVLAARNPDPVLPREAVPAPMVATPDRLTPEERLQLEKALLPANQGRNHAASSALPKVD
ncbi:MAG: nitrogen fixation protein FixH [Tepidimonas sp.]|uniref:nitrogen fixation protein FixH n=1 Tax=Tepidimonas sp. TaxID=2002775 RepID=UPI004054ABD6